MPDAAFDATTRRLLSLVHAGAEGLPIEVRGYRLPHLGTEQASPSSPLLRYEDLHALYDEPPDALFVTGARPTATDITLEPFWGDLAKLIKWACERVPSTLLSCLASHAAAVALHGIERTPLPSKRCGVFEQEVDRSHFLMRRLGASVSLPHSRFNDISSEDLLRHGYDILVASADSGWTVATREESGRLLVLLQGHPEYSSTTLLREYRRDVNEYLQGTASDLSGDPGGVSRPGWRGAPARTPPRAPMRAAGGRGQSLPLPPHVLVHPCRLAGHGIPAVRELGNRCRPSLRPRPRIRDGSRA